VSYYICGKQNIAFKRHDNSNVSHSANKGNFKAMLEYRALDGELLKSIYLHAAAKDAQYASTCTQNEIMKIFKLIILQKIADVKKVDFFTIICNEYTDTSNQEQLSFSLRYVSSEKVCESFNGFYELDEVTTGEGIAETTEKNVNYIPIKW